MTSRLNLEDQLYANAMAATSPDWRPAPPPTSEAGMSRHLLTEVENIHSDLTRLRLEVDQARVPLGAIFLTCTFATVVAISLVCAVAQLTRWAFGG